MLTCGFVMACSDNGPGGVPSIDIAEGLPVGRISATEGSVTSFSVFEVVLGAEEPSRNPYVLGPGVTARFEGVSGEAAGRLIDVSGFWDGDNTWRIRFAPIATGLWRFSTTSTDPGLHGVTGELRVRVPTDAELNENRLLHGFLEAEGEAWRLSDGTRFFPVGDSQWSFSEEFHRHEIEAWIDALRTLGLNTLHGSVWLGRYDRGGMAPFPEGDPESELLNIDYFRRLDGLVRYANANGVMPGLMIGSFPQNAMWFERFRTRARHDRWFRYVVARYAAFNVRWLLFGEVDERDPPWDMTWQDAVAYYAELVRRVDPWDHPIGSHHRLVDTASATNPDIDYIEVQAVQTETQFERALEYRKWGKPVWFEEYWYESARYDDEVERGLRNTHRNFVAALAFPTMGSLMRAHADDVDFPPSEAADQGMSLTEYLLAEDRGLRRLGEFAAFYQPLDLLRFEPANVRCDRGVCGRFGEDFALLLPGGGAVSIDLSDAPGQYQVRMLSIHVGSIADLEPIDGGARRSVDTFSDRDTAVLLLKLDSEGRED